jgi:hypothetical protein
MSTRDKPPMSSTLVVNLPPVLTTAVNELYLGISSRISEKNRNSANGFKKVRGETDHLKNPSRKFCDADPVIEYGEYFEHIFIFFVFVLA